MINANSGIGGGGKTKGVYTWEKYESQYVHKIEITGTAYQSSGGVAWSNFNNKDRFDKTTGKYEGKFTYSSINDIPANKIFLDPSVPQIWVTNSISGNNYMCTWYRSNSYVLTDGYQNVLVGYVTDDNSSKYPNNGTASDGFLYKKINFMSMMEVESTRVAKGTFTPASNESQHTIAHNFNVFPKYIFVWAEGSPGLCKRAVFSFERKAGAAAVGSASASSASSSSMGSSTSYTKTFVLSCANSNFYYQAGYTYHWLALG